MKLARNQILDLNYIFRVTNWVHTKENPIKSVFRHYLKHNVTESEKVINEINEVFPDPEYLPIYIQKENQIKDEFSKKEIVLHDKYGVKYNKDTKQYETDELSDESKEALEAEHIELKTEYKSVLDKLNEDNKDFLDEYNALQKEKKEFLEESIEIDFRQFKLSSMPDISFDNKVPHWQIWEILETLLVE